METSLGRKMRPSTVETIRDQLDFKGWKRPSWLAYHFPAIAERATPVEYADVEGMTAEQADSVRHLLATSILYGRKIIWRRRAGRVGFLVDANADVDDDWSIRLKQLEEALRDLCEVYDPPYPL